jgi:squalene-associated FAD-dependent desaturase
VSAPARATVVGGGIAGVTAALDLAATGAHVRLYEKRRHLGGSAWSFRRQGRTFDNGQHVFLRCCTAYLGLLDRLGARDDVVLQDRLDIPVLAAAPAARGRRPGRVARIRRAPLPAPVHLAPSILRYPHLGWADRLRAGRAVWALRRLDRHRPDIDDEDFGTWLRDHGQSDRAVERLWDLITVPTVNLPAAEASLSMAAMVFQVGLLTDPAAADIGWSRVPLGRIHGERSLAALEAAGVDVVLGTDVDAVTPTGVVVGGREEAADGVVVAVPPEVADQLVPADARRGTADWSVLGSSPIVTVHVVYDRRVTDLPLAAVLGTPTLWVFDRSEGAGVEPPGQGLAVTVSAASAWIGRRPADLVAEVTAALAAQFPAAGAATVVDAVVSREHTATFRARPGTAAHRPGAGTAWPNLVLAGAWTDTGWPATMEGAVRSGHTAAAALAGTLAAMWDAPRAGAATDADAPSPAAPASPDPADPATPDRAADPATPARGADHRDPLAQEVLA